MEMLKDFMAQNEEAVMSFPAALSGNERRIIHEVSISCNKIVNHEILFHTYWLQH